MQQRTLVRVGSMVLLGLMAACSDPNGSPSSASERAEQPLTIIPGQSVGPIHAGMTMQEVVAALGEPARRTANALDYPKLGLAVVPNEEGLAQVVMCGDVMGPDGPYARAFKGRTPEGIGMFSTREELIRAYGEPSDSRGKAGAMESLKYEKQGITFNLQGNKVYHLIVVLRGKEPAAESSISLDLVPAPAPDKKP